MARKSVVLRTPGELEDRKPFRELRGVWVLCVGYVPNKVISDFQAFHQFSGAQTRHRKIPADLKASLLCTEPPIVLKAREMD
ncbi:hypothetical protein PoB_002135600 [Plakobranchus ocellatus]|uniref:Uncharacterized protein n=1 Tax=Plakobranchus ocellatus TaxID=259542 RepID=A0AAV3Z6A1_9GAST|nr:hypothetical protein PoB_002135600 [Plakobranchus ocellatus]